MDQQALATLLTELRSHSHETEWIEFKRNHADPQKIGEYLSALSNSAGAFSSDSTHADWRSTVPVACRWV